MCGWQLVSLVGRLLPEVMSQFTLSVDKKDLSEALSRGAVWKTCFLRG